jgi:hypothetical protein
MVVASARQPNRDDGEGDQVLAGRPLHEVPMDGWTRFLLGITAVAVTGYIALIYGGCALDARCHLRSCPHAKYACGVMYDAQPKR